MIIITNPPYFPFASGNFRVSSPYGMRSGSMHKGIDLVDTSSILHKDHNVVISVQDGQVINARQVTDKSNLTWEWGKYIAIQQTDGYIAYYCHLSEIDVEIGQFVAAGDRIGKAGNTGKSYGTHLHFEIRLMNEAQDPAEYLGIENVAGTFVKWSRVPDYEDIVMKKCGLEEQTRKYINDYKYAQDLWRKLAEQML